MNRKYYKMVIALSICALVAVGAGGAPSEPPARAAYAAGQHEREMSEAETPAVGKSAFGELSALEPPSNDEVIADEIPALGSSASGLEADRQAQKDLTEIIGEAAPSVVGIIGKLGKSSKEYYEDSNNIMFGSGIIYKSNGYIVSNYHVVADCELIFIILSDRKVYKAKVIGVDEDSDLALVKIDKGMLKPVEFADSASVKTGEPVITIGTPVVFDLHNSVGQGIISGINRGNTGFTEYQFLQTDAVSNPGNSGGPLMNYDGKVLGIIEGGYVSYPGITFCIPSQTIQYIIPQLILYGRVRRADPGATLVQSLMADYGLPNDQGLFFTDIIDGGPLALAGVGEADRLLSLNGIHVNSYTEYAEELMKYLPGDTAELTLVRDGVKRTVQITFDEKE